MNYQWLSFYLGWIPSYAIKFENRFLKVIQFLSRLYRVSTWGGSSSDVSSGAENSAIVAEGRDRDGGRDHYSGVGCVRKDKAPHYSAHCDRNIHQISAKTNKVNMSGFRFLILILHLHPFQQLCPLLLLPLCKSPRRTMIIYFSFILLSHLIVPCMGLLQLWRIYCFY